MTPTEKFAIQDIQLEIPSGMLNEQLRQALAGGRYVDAELRAVKQLLQPQDVYFEVGSSAGVLSTAAHRVIADKARIHVYEPDKRMIALLRRTWKANGAEGNAYPCLLGAGPGEHSYHVAKAFWASSRLVNYGAGKTIQVTQRDFLQQLDKKAATFLVVEAQGSERDLLDKVLSPRVRAVVARLHPRIAGEVAIEALVRCLDEQGFRCVFEQGPTRAWAR